MEMNAPSLNPPRPPVERVAIKCGQANAHFQTVPGVIAVRCDARPWQLLAGDAEQLYCGYSGVMVFDVSRMLSHTTVERLIRTLALAGLFATKVYRQAEAIVLANAASVTDVTQREDVIAACSAHLVIPMEEFAVYLVSKERGIEMLRTHALEFLREIVDEGDGLGVAGAQFAMHARIPRHNRNAGNVLQLAHVLEREPGVLAVEPLFLRRKRCAAAAGEV